MEDNYFEILIEKRNGEVNLERIKLKEAIERNYQEKIKALEKEVEILEKRLLTRNLYIELYKKIKRHPFQSVPSRLYLEERGLYYK